MVSFTPVMRLPFGLPPFGRWWCKAVSERKGYPPKATGEYTKMLWLRGWTPTQPQPHNIPIRMGLSNKPFYCRSIVGGFSWSSMVWALANPRCKPATHSLPGIRIRHWQSCPARRKHFSRNTGEDSRCLACQKAKRELIDHGSMINHALQIYQ